MSLVAKDKKFFGRTDPSRGIEIVGSQGNYLLGPKGKKYIDFHTGWGVGNVGWNNKEIKKAVKTFAGPDYVGPSFLYKPWAELAEILAKMTPGKLSKSFRVTGGTEAVDIALQAASLYTKRYQFLSIDSSYHGDSIAATTIGKPDFKDPSGKTLLVCHKIKPPLNKNTADKLEPLLQKKEIAALIMEPMVCGLGPLAPEPDFMTRMQALCKQYGTLVIMDEVATGFGRTGKLFATEHYAIAPDIMCLAKGISGGYGALGATIMTNEVAKAMEHNYNYYSTYGWHPLAVTAAIANLKYMLRHKKAILANTNTMGAYIAERLATMSFKFPGQISVHGLLIGIKFQNAAEYVEKVMYKAQKNGLLIWGLGDRILLFPPLNIDKKTVTKAMDILENALL